jgi:hypothetical protein
MNATSIFMSSERFSIDSAADLVKHLTLLTFRTFPISTILDGGYCTVEGKAILGTRDILYIALRSDI